MYNGKALLVNNKTGGIFFLVFVLACSLPFHVSGKPENTRPAEIAKLISRLDLDREGLEKIRKAFRNPDTAGKKLLSYYRNRTSVKHPVNRGARKTSLGISASVGEIRTADNALKHVFIGQSAYPPDFRGEDIDWSTNPVRDNEWLWQLHRMYFWDAMAKAYWNTGDEKYAREWCAQLLDWTRKNPNDGKHGYAWRSIEAGIRGHSWTGLYQRFIDSPSYTPDLLVAFLNSMYDHAEFLMAQYRSLSNWGLMEAEGLAFIAITFPEFRNAAVWKTEALRRLNNEINLQVYPDGHQRELAIGYHLGCIDWFLRTFELTKLNGIENAFPASYLEKIEKMCEVPMKLGHPDGTNAQFGDAWAGRPGQHQGEFMTWAKLFGRNDFLYLATNGMRGEKPGETAFALKESGLYSMRSGWDKNAVCLVLKCGPDGGGHCQPDNGTFELSAGGRTLMPDAGSYIYSGDPENRAWFRQTKVHQTMTLDGKNSRYGPKLLLWQPGDSLDILVVENKGYENLIHRRSLFFVNKKYFIIVDDAIGTATGDIDIHFQLAPGKAVADAADLSFRTDFAEGRNVWVKTMRQTGIELEEEEGRVSFLYTKKELRPAFRFRIKKETSTGQVRFITLVVPYDEEKPDLTVKPAGEQQTGSSHLRLEISENGKSKIVEYSL